MHASSPASPAGCGTICRSRLTTLKTGTALSLSTISCSVSGRNGTGTVVCTLDAAAEPSACSASSTDATSGRDRDAGGANGAVGDHAAAQRSKNCDMG